MDVKQAYNLWAEQYDTNINRTRDLEGISLRTSLANSIFNNCLEIGCGTGKNTGWLIQRAKRVTAVDLSDEMLAMAGQKIQAATVQFVQADITQNWTFTDGLYDLVVFSLVLEHIEDLDAVFEKLSPVTTSNACVYIGELHPFKQYTGTKARFDTEQGQQIVTCFNHHISDFTAAAKKYDFAMEEITEYFDDNDRNTIPRILTMLFRKKQ
jgi:ubiquinone/menaquinone biosynthesis C-methylase UbiE